NDEPAVTEIVGIARRVPPRRPPAPAYDGVRWEQIDISLPVADAHAEKLLVNRLSDAVAGADAVVHLAWQMQPHRHRSVLRRSNVAGTWRVVRGWLQAGVPRIVAASSVGAYSPARGNDPRDETWPAGGIGGSHYSVDKAADRKSVV